MDKRYWDKLADQTYAAHDKACQRHEADPCYTLYRQTWILFQIHFFARAMATKSGAAK